MSRSVKRQRTTSKDKSERKKRASPVESALAAIEKAEQKIQKAKSRLTLAIVAETKSEVSASLRRIRAVKAGLERMLTSGLDVKKTEFHYDPDNDNRITAISLTFRFPNNESGVETVWYSDDEAAEENLVQVVCEGNPLPDEEPPFDETELEFLEEYTQMLLRLIIARIFRKLEAAGRPLDGMSSLRIFQNVVQE